jgi:enamine deaminase RidA (YjgF/YER057c/UK114 family)
MSSSKVQGFNYKGYEEIAEKYCLSAAVSVSLIGTRLIATSGHVGLDKDGQIGRSLKEQMELAFQV